jgi:4-amino-4-deoxy-L-arabinose transferase-like glycosyltransferase
VTRPAAGWLALLLAGQAATLQMVQAGPFVRYQHYPPLPRLLAETHPAALAVFLLEIIAVLWGLAAAGRRAGSLPTPPGQWTLLLLGAGFVLTSTTLSRSLSDYAGELLLASLVQLVHLGCVFLLARSLTAPEREAISGVASRWLGPPGEPAGEAEAGDRFAWMPAIWVTAVAAILALVSYQSHPHVPDEVVYLLQAHYFAEGRLTLPLPPVPEAFDLDLMTYEATRWFSPTSPAWPAILAIGVVAGAPWLVNPVLGGVNVLLAYRLLLAFYPRRTARIAVVLLAVSPWNLFMAMSFMPHTATLTCALAAAVAVARLRRDPRLRFALIGGFFLGMVGLIRPLEGVVLALLLGLWSLGARGRRLRLLPSVGLTLAALGTAAIVLPYNTHLTGSAGTFPINTYVDARYGAGHNDLGFGSNRGMGWSGLDPLPGHGAADVAINANFNLFQINVELLGWATGSLLVLLLWLGTGRAARSDRLMLAAIVAIAGIHSFYYFSGGPDFGARYWFLAIVPCLALAARGIEELERRADAMTPGAGGRVLGATGALVAGALLVFVPWRAADKYHYYRGMRPDIRQLSARYPWSDGIVLIRGNRHPDFASAAVYNPVDLGRELPVYAWDRGGDIRRRLVAAYPGRRFWIVNGPTLTGRGYQVAAGPLSSEALLARADSGAAVP